MAALVGILTGFGRMLPNNETIAFSSRRFDKRLNCYQSRLVGGLAWIANLALTGCGSRL